MTHLQQNNIQNSIHVLRNQRVILDADLAKIYGTTTKHLNQQLKRNLNRFPEDFMFQLTEEEDKYLRTQTPQSETGRGGSRYLPYAFTEHGAVMLASVLSSPVAVATSIQVVRAFISLRQMLSSQAELARKLDLLERKYDHQFKIVFDAIRELTLIPEKSKKRIGIVNED
ncbi:ORF6N domain-containing protein [bacterium]|nr:ORF6N domain-containing protein [bacterium]